MSEEPEYDTVGGPVDEDSADALAGETVEGPEGECAHGNAVAYMQRGEVLMARNTKDDCMVARVEDGKLFPCSLPNGHAGPHDFQPGRALCGDRTVALNGEIVECREPLGHRGYHSQGFHGGWLWNNSGKQALDLGTTKAGTIVETVNGAGEKGFGRLSADVGVYLAKAANDEPDVYSAGDVPKAWAGSHPPPDPGPEVCGCDESKMLAETIVDLDRSLKAERASGAAVVQELVLERQRAQTEQRSAVYWHGEFKRLAQQQERPRCSARSELVGPCSLRADHPGFHYSDQRVQFADFGGATINEASPAPPSRSSLARAFLTVRLAELAGVTLACVIAVAVRVEGALSRGLGE